MLGRLDRTLYLLGACALLGSIGCGAPPEEDAAEAEGLRQSRQALESGPDFIVQAASASPNVLPGGDLEVKFTVCNQGTVGEYAAVNVFLSLDKQLSPAVDPRIGDLPVGWLPPGQCYGYLYPFSTTGVPEGAWYVGVTTSSLSAPETDTNNNARIGTRLHIGTQPDYLIQAVSGPATVTPGAWFTTAVTVCNKGTAGGDGANVQLVLSEDATIRFSPSGPPAQQDLPLISFHAGPLQAGQCTTQQVETYVLPPHEGTWYLGAVVDPANSEPEFLETNNTRASKPVGIGYQPDFVIQSVSGPASVPPGAPFTASVKVCNQGTSSGGTEVQLVLSEDATIRFSPSAPPEQQDLPLTSFFSGPLAVGQCETQQIQASVSPPHDGTWYLGAVADPSSSVQELIETNNTRASKPLGIGSQPDFVVQSVSSPGHILPLYPFKVKVTVCNQGTAGSGGTEVQLVLSADTAIQYPPSGPSEHPDLLLTSFFSGPLAAGQCATQQVEAQVGSVYEEIPYHLGAVADPGNVEGELIETNNTRASAAFGIGFRPDFTITSVSGPASVLPGEPFTASVTVCNQGIAPDYNLVHLVLSEDTTVRTVPSIPSEEPDLLLGSFYAPPLGQGQCLTQQVQAQAQPPHEGIWYLGAIADAEDAFLEFNEANNTRVSAAVGIGYLPDYTIQSVSGPATALPGQALTASVKVCNQGTVGGNGSEVQLVLSEDTTLGFPVGGPPEEQDVPLTSFTSGPLAAGQCKVHTVQVGVSPPHEGTWYLGARVDPGNSVQELIETNNARASKPVGFGQGPDYVIQSVVAPASVLPGAPLTVDVTVCNQGTAGNGGTDVRLLLSEGSEPSEEQDLLLTSFFSEPLAPAQCRTHPVQTQAQPPREGVWHLVAWADPGNAVPELLETNNTHGSATIGIGDRPDFIVQSVSGPTIVPAGSYFDVTVTVCNQGTLAGSAFGLLVMSEDTIITGWHSEGEFPIASFYTSQLEPGQCTTELLGAGPEAPQDGTWYLGATVDPSDYPYELNASNNTRVGGRISIGHRPDLVIQAVGVPASAAPWEPFTTSVTVCNQGTAFSGGADVQLVLSEDTAIHFSSNAPPEGQDPPLTSFFSGPLEAGQCTTQQLQTSAQPPHEGIWYVGAVADPGHIEQEFIETNNSRASEPFGIGSRPDYIISSVTSPANVKPGEPFTASVTVCNQGTASGGGAQVQVVLSEDTSVEQDLPVASFFSEPLEPGQCRTQQVQPVVYPPHEGTWYLGAVVDPDNSTWELIETNNSRVGKPFGIGYRPDYLISSVSVPPSVRPGDPVTVEVTVCNQGTVGTGGTDVQVVLSEDTSIRFSLGGPSDEQDLPVASFSSGSLEPGQCRTQQVQTSLQPPRHGIWYVGAVADPGSFELELIETNNTRASKLLGIGHQPDFIVQSVSTPAKVLPGDTFEMNVTVCNQGTEEHDAIVEGLLSSDKEISALDTNVGYGNLGWLPPGQCKSGVILASASVPEGAWYPGVIVSAYYGGAPEFDTTNNARAGALMGIGYRPDYVIQTVTGPAIVNPGDSFTTSVTICNHGTVVGIGADVQLVLSEDTAIHFSPDAPPQGQDLPLGSFHSGPLEQGQCRTQQVQASVQPPHEGAWYLGAVADPGDFELELIETNNTRASAPVGMGHAPDLIIRELSEPVHTGSGQFHVSVTVCNQGTAAGGEELVLVASEDADLHYFPNAPGPQDYSLGSWSTGSLEPGQCRKEQVESSYGHVPHEGAWYLGAVVDPWNRLPELLESNNTRAGRVAGLGFRPDFVIEAVSVPANVESAQQFTASVTVCNQGAVGGETEVHLVLSEDADIRFSLNTPGEGDLALSYFSSGPLSPGECATRQVQTDVQPPHEGAWYLGAVADAGESIQETLETNNSRASKPVGIGRGLDYIIQSVSVPTGVLPGESFTASVTVCNQGTWGDDYDTFVQLVLSTDTDIRFSFQSSSGEQDLPVASFWAQYLGQGQCSTHQVQVSAQVPQEGIWYLGAIADAEERDWELIETNNTGVSKAFGIGYQPDFIIQAISGPVSVKPGEPFSSSVTVCNQGTTEGTADVSLVLSEDTAIRFSSDNPSYEQDVLLTSFTPGPLAPGQCTTQQVQTSVTPPHEGAWYLGAVADPGNSTPELIETNNTRASKPVGIGHQPDFIVKEVSGPASVRPGEQFFTEVTVCNQGTVGGDADVILMLSEDRDLTLDAMKDQRLATGYHGFLGPGQCSPSQWAVSVQVPHEGAWYLGAWVVPAGPELSDANNSRVGDLIGIGHQPDYVIQSVNLPASIFPGQPFNASVTLCNQGTVGSGSTNVALILSEDTTLSLPSSSSPQTDWPVSSFVSDPLDPGQCRTHEVEVSVYPPYEGAWHLGAMADPENSTPELLETNNTRTGKPFGVGYQPDYVIQSVNIPASTRPGETFTASVTVCNQGTMGSGGTEVQLILSRDTTLQLSSEGEDLPVTSFFADSLDAGVCETREVQVSVQPPQEGVWYLGAVADPGGSTPELLETNNSRASKAFGIGYQPDYVIQSVNVPASFRPGDLLSMEVTVCNQGTMPGSSRVEILLSEDTTLVSPFEGAPGAWDMEVATFNWGPLEPGTCSTYPVQTYLQPPHEGAWYLGAVAWPGNSEQEFLVTNNRRASGVVGIGHAADLVIRSVKGPASVTLGQPYEAVVTVCNQGTVSSTYQDLLVMLSDDAHLMNPSGTGDLPVDYLLVEPLAPGQCQALTSTVDEMPPSEGRWYLGAIVDMDDVLPELVETNNTRVSGGILFHP